MNYLNVNLTPSQPHSQDWADFATVFLLVYVCMNGALLVCRSAEPFSSTFRTIMCKYVTNSILLLYEALCAIISQEHKYCLNEFFVDIC